MIIQRLLETQNKEIEGHLLICLLNLSSSANAQKALYKQRILEIFIKSTLDEQFCYNIQTVYRIFVNLSPAVADKSYLYQQTVSIILRDILSLNKTTRELSLAFLAVLIKDTSEYERDMMIFPSVIQNLDHDDLEVPDFVFYFL